MSRDNTAGVSLDDLEYGGSVGSNFNDAAQPASINQSSSTGQTPIRYDSPGKGKSFFSKAYYQSYFNVSTKLFLKRCLKAIIPVGKVLYPPPTQIGSDGESDVPHPDLYGPFWITTTLIFLMAVVANFVDYLKNFSGDNKVEWYYDFEKVTLAATMFYLSVLLWPTIVYFILRSLNAGRPLSNIISLYGYSFTIYIPVSILCAIPVPYFSIIWISIAFVISTFFLCRNLYSYFLSAPVPSSDNVDAVKQHKKTGLLLMAGVAAIHAGIAVISYFYFFKYTSTITP